MAAVEGHGGPALPSRETPTPPPPRRVLVWAALSVLMAGAAGAVGYSVAGPTEREPADPPVPRLLQVEDILSAGEARTQRAVRRARAQGRRAGYRRGLARGRTAAREALLRQYRPGGREHKRIFAGGRRAGERQALGRFGFEDDGFYVVGIAEGGRRVGARHGPLPKNKAYVICREGRAVCVSDADS